MQLTTIYSKDYNLLSMFLLHNIKLPHKSLNCKINEELRKITKSDSAISLSIITLSLTKRIIRPNFTYSLSSKPTTS